MENALHALTRADQILESVEDHFPEDDETLQPVVAAGVWIARSMCLLVDALEGVEDVEFATEERVPVAQTKQPYAYLAAKYGARALEYEAKTRSMGSLWDPTDTPPSH